MHVRASAVFQTSIIFACAALSVLDACAPGPQGLNAARVRPAPAHLNAEDEAHASHLLRTLQRAEAARDHGAASAMRATLFERYPNSEAAAQLYEERAHAAEKVGATAEAIDQYEHLLLLRPQYVRIDAARTAYALLLVTAGRADDAVHLYRGLAAGPAGDHSEAARENIGRALIEPLAQCGRPRLALELLVDARGFDGCSPAERDAFSARAPGLIEALSDPDLDALLSAHSEDPRWQWLRNRLAMRLAKSALLAQDEDAQRRLLESIMRTEPTSPLAEEANHLMAQVSARGEVDPHAVGVLLPLTGRFKQFGERSQAAIELAFAAYPNIKLIIKDTQGDPNLASQAVEALVYENHAIAAIGPLFSGESVAAASRAESLGLPSLSLSHQEDLTKTGRYIFRTALTVQAQAKALAKTAFEELHLRRFAILAPKSRYGTAFLQAFWDEVDARRGTIRGVELYDPEATTFRQPIRRLVGRWFLNARPEFRDALKELKEQELPGVRMRNEVAKLDKQARPIIDFDGLVVPDSGRQLGLIAPALAFEDIALSRDVKELDKMRRTLSQNDIAPITLLGASTWNNQQTLDACERYCESAVFVDAYFSGSQSPNVRAFVTAFTDKTGSPPLLGEAQAFDTARMLGALLSSGAAPDSRGRLVAALHGVTDYDGVCGHMHFDDAGEIQRDLQSLTIRARRIEALSSAAPPVPAVSAPPPSPHRERHRARHHRRGHRR